MSVDIVDLLPRAADESLFEANLRRSSVGAVVASMPLVHESIMGGKIDYNADKANESVVSMQDIQSEQQARSYLAERHPDVPTAGEEEGTSGNQDARYLFLIDPIDGSRPHQTGAVTSTIISGVYDRERKQMIAATVAEPATGRMWHGDGEQTVRVLVDPRTGELRRAPEPVHVWPEVVKNPTVLVENPQAFSRGDRQMLTGADCVRLFAHLQSGAAIQNYGSNGAHHAMIANGSRLAGGSITTSVGGEWDLPGALLVTSAGGVVQGLRLNADRTLELTDGLDPYDCDMLLTAAQPETLDFMLGALAKALRPEATVAL